MCFHCGAFIGIMRFSLNYFVSFLLSKWQAHGRKLPGTDIAVKHYA